MIRFRQKITPWPKISRNRPRRGSTGHSQLRRRTDVASPVRQEAEVPVHSGAGTRWIPDRRNIKRGQTPQGFNFTAILTTFARAFASGKELSFPDDCGLFLKYADGCELPRPVPGCHPDARSEFQPAGGSSRSGQARPGGHQSGDDSQRQCHRHDLSGERSAGPLLTGQFKKCHDHEFRETGPAAKIQFASLEASLFPLPVWLTLRPSR